MIEEVLKVSLEAGDAKREAESLGATMTKSFINAQLAVDLLKKGLSLVAEQLKAGVADAIKYDQTIAKRTAALTMQRAPLEWSNALLERQAGILEDLTTISDEEIRSLQTRALNLGKTTTQVDQLVRASVRLGRVTGTDVASAMDQLLKSEAGLIDRTMRLVPGIAALSKEQLAAGDATKLVNERFGEFLDIESQGQLTGKVAKLSTAWSNLREELAKMLLNAAPLNSFIDDLTSRLKLLGDVRTLGGGFGERMRNLIVGMWSPEMREQMAKDAEAARIMADIAAGTFGVKAEANKPSRKKTTGSLLRAEAEKIGDTEVIMIGGLPVDIATGKIMSPEPPDESAIRVALDRASELRSEYEEGIRQEKERLREEDLQREIELQDKLYDVREQARVRDRQAILGSGLFERITRESFGQELNETMEERAERMRENMANVGASIDDIFNGVAANFQNTLLGAFETLAEGGSVNFGDLMLAFLKSTGSMLIADGIKNIFQGTGMILSSLGMNPAGYALAGLGAAEVGAGAIMMTGVALAGGASGAQSAGRGGGGGASTSAYRASGSPSTAMQGGGAPQTIIINVHKVGRWTAEDTGGLEQALRDAQRKGLAA
ncbi:MAG TPA: hypothetical protein VJ787_04870 [Thermoleophilia bacterium]|nr:hypothetical protein [Thermoleophilia bacterium]